MIGITTTHRGILAKDHVNLRRIGASAWYKTHLEADFRVGFVRMDKCSEA